MATPRVTIDELPEQVTVEDTNLLIIQDSGVTKKMTVATLQGATSTALAAHLADTDDAHDASAISSTDSGFGIDSATVQGQLGQLATLASSAGATGPQGPPGDPGIVIDDVPPEETNVLWADTTESSELAVGDTVTVFTYTDESDDRPDSTVVFWIPNPVTLGNPFGALAGDCVLRSTPDVVANVNGISGLWAGTAAAYDALTTNPSTLYVVVG